MAIPVRLDYSALPASTLTPDGSPSFPLIASLTQLPNGATPLSASTTGTTGIITCSFVPTAGKTAYLSSVVWCLGGATAAGATTASLTNVGGGAGGLSYIVSWPIINGPVTPLILIFNPALVASAISTTIFATIGAGQGAGGLLESISMYGYQI